jgi:putative transposase
MPQRKVPLINNEVYHIYNRSIAKYRIFNNEADYERICEMLLYYAIKDPPCKFSLYKEMKDKIHIKTPISIESANRLIDIVAYCIMPTHIHLVLSQLVEDGISLFLRRISQSYSMYFNNEHKRNGPLWESRFNNVLVKTDEQLLHLTRYVHLNPVTANIINNPADWEYSSFREYAGLINERDNICNFSKYIKIDPSYIQFVNDHLGYQREIGLIKELRID